MRARVGIALLGVTAACPVLAEPLAPEAARNFIAGKLFAYNCFDGTHGVGRIYSDGSVAGSVQVRGSGPMRQVVLPAGTLKVKGQTYCAAMRGMPIEPCFNLNRTNDTSFRGSLFGLGFAYCDFTRSNARPAAVRAAWGLRSSLPGSIGGRTERKPE